MQSFCKKCHTKYIKSEKGQEVRKRTYLKNKKKYREKAKNNYKKNPSKYRGYELKRKFNLTTKNYDNLFKKQKGLCVICGLLEVTKRKGRKLKLSVDHNHNTRKVRGLLCNKCNRALGLLDVDKLGILNLQKAMEYLKKHDNEN